jgi:uncharacterized Zn finger protein
MPRNRSKSDPFQELTWRDIEDWAGSKIVSRGKRYQKSRQVQDLARTPRGGIVAWVRGTQRYVTLVEFKGGDLLSTCSCPYGSTCKHAVAVVLEYLECLKKNISVITVSTNDRRFELLEAGIEEQTRDEEDDEISDQFKSKDQVKSASHDSASFLEKQTNEQLISLTKDLAERHPEVRNDLQDRQNLLEGNIKQLVRSIQTEIRELSSEPDWTNHWKNEGYIPDYSNVKKRLKGLLDLGHADAVVTLGKELLERGRSRQK